MGKSFKQRLSSLIYEKGYTPASLAKKLDIGKSTFHNWVNNEAPNLPRIDDANKIANALGVSLDYLYTGNELYCFDTMDIEFLGLIKSLDKDTKRELLGIVRREVRLYDEGNQKGGTGSETQAG